MWRKGLTGLSQRCLDRKWFILTAKDKWKTEVDHVYSHLPRMLLKKELSLHDWEKAIKEVRAQVEMDEAAESGPKLFESVFCFSFLYVAEINQDNFKLHPVPLAPQAANISASSFPTQSL